MVFFFKQKTAYEMRISDWSSDVCSSDLPASPAVAEKWAGGGHDGMEYFALPDVDANSRGLLAMNYEYPDFNILMAGDYDPAAASADQKAIALSAVGIGVVEIAKDGDGKWTVQAG